MNASAENAPSATETDGPQPIYFIFEHTNGTDIDHYRTCSSSMTGDGYFTDKAAAEARAEALAEPYRRAFEQEVAVERAKYEAAVAKMEAREREIAALRAAGIEPTIEPLRPPYDYSANMTFEGQEDYIDFTVEEFRPAQV